MRDGKAQAKDLAELEIRVARKGKEAEDLEREARELRARLHGALAWPLRLGAEWAGMEEDGWLRVRTQGGKDSTRLSSCECELRHAFRFVCVPLPPHLPLPAAEQSPPRPVPLLSGARGRGV